MIQVTKEIIDKLVEHDYKFTYTYPYPKPITPKISEVLKWLREEHVFHVEILREKYNGWMYFIQLLDASYVSNGNGFDTYESAALAGIEYCLDNLI